MKRYTSIFSENFTQTPDFKHFLEKLPERLLHVLEFFDKYHFETRIVGGVVRDLFLEMEPRDIDIITKAAPDETIFILNEYRKFTNQKDTTDISVSGIEHGTVKLKFLDNEDEVYEITSLDYIISDIIDSTSSEETLEIDYKNDWIDDANRRDFTINAMSLDRTGKIYDYFDGKKHLQEQRIKFIGNFKEKIKNDPILIYRFFKIFAKFEKPKYDSDVLIFMKKNVNLVENIEKDRRSKELDGIESQLYGNKTINYINKSFQELLV